VSFPENTTFDAGLMTSLPTVSALIWGPSFSDLIRSCISRSSLQLSQVGSAQYGEPCGLVSELGWEFSWLAILFPFLCKETVSLTYRAPQRFLSVQSLAQVKTVRRVWHSVVGNAFEIVACSRSE